VFIEQRDGTGKSRGFAITQHVNSLGLPQLAPVEVLLCWSDFHVLLPHSSGGGVRRLLKQLGIRR